MGRLVAIALGVVGLVACSESYGTQETPAAGADAGSDASGLVADAGDGGTSGRFCPTPAVPNTACWDFEDGEEPAAVLLGGGSVALDSNVVVSGKHSLRARTPALAMGAGKAWARIEDSVAGAPKKASIQLRAYVDEGFAYASIAEINFSASEVDFYSVSLRAGGDGSIRLSERTRVANVSTHFNEPTLPAIGLNKWVELAIEVEVFGFPGPSPTRRVVVKTNGTARYDETGTAGIEKLVPSSTWGSAGVTYTESYSNAMPEQTVHIDDVLVTWTP